MIRALGAILLGLLVFAVPAAAQTFPPLTGRVVDQANIIPDDREAAMVMQLEALQRATSRQLVVATVSSLEDYPIEDYANRLFREWRLGQAQANNGILLLVAPNERRVRIEVGYGLEGIVTDAVSSRIINEQIVPRFREGDYPGGIEVGTAALVSQLAAPPEQAEQAAIEAERARYRDGSGEGGGDAWIVLVGFLVIFGLPIVLTIVGATGGRRSRRISPWGRSYGHDRDDSGIGWIVAGAVLDAFLSGRGGGGSSWGGGGGGSWGGGGGGFSGGGGSSGGGGASGSW